ncbi:nuclear transport factor 2 family protein [Sediminibacterium goheungense]|uniref:Putative lumazine-binding protein n=1 Tax=Sediminibacterium goheungense TaxID=1086393 RepID=A0A4R6J1K3_9BACT|nr:nuclear transport factor 2 family protein [Sediminibacterium goheungense]TDO29130.1 putative lumazine-binding protein [Sediminibacterium goheungense]
MRKIIIIVLLGISLTTHSQTPDEKAIKETIDSFFLSLEKQDTTLLKNVVFIDGQLWRVSNISNSRKFDMRDFRADINKLISKNKVKEIPHRYEIKIHNGIAMAWVPYEFLVNEKFSHCGVDVFTLIHASGVWKIVNASYTIDTTGCEELKKNK